MSTFGHNHDPANIIHEHGEFPSMAELAAEAAAPLAPSTIDRIQAALARFNERMATMHWAPPPLPPQWSVARPALRFLAGEPGGGKAPTALGMCTGREYVGRVQDGGVWMTDSHSCMHEATEIVIIAATGHPVPYCSRHAQEYRKIEARAAASQGGGGR